MNTGLTGLWEYPTAEMPDDGVGRFGYTKATPYGFYFLDLAWLPWFEINARFTTFNTIKTGVKRRRDYMDKAIDLKVMLWHSKDPEKWIIPSIAFGVVDMMGTELMKAWYGVATWRYKNFALSLGYGTDRFNGFYGGIEWDIFDWLTFKAEYSPLDYTQDGYEKGSKVFKGHEDMLPDKKYNAGIVLKAPWGMEGSISYQRGNEWVFGISQKINLNGPFLGNHKKNYGAPGDMRVAEWEDIESDILISKIQSGLEKYVRVRDVDVKLDSSNHSHKLYLSYENYGYSSHAEAMTRVLVVLAAVMPETDELILIHKNAGIPIVKASFPGSLLFDIRARSLRKEDTLNTAIFGWVGSQDIQDPDAQDLLKHKAQHTVKAMVVYEPRLDQTLDDDYMDRWDIDLVYQGRYYGGWGSVVDVRFPIFNNIDTQDYTGLWWEKDLNDKIRLQQAGLTYANKLTKDGRLWFFGEGGWFDEEWFGTNFWGRYYGKDGSWWIGARASAFHDRDPESFAGLTEGTYRYYSGWTSDRPAEHEWYMPYWIQAGYHLADFDLDINLSWGRYVNKDKGYKIEVVRHWDDTALGFWYIDTDVHTRDKSFTRAGVHMEIPAEKWLGTLFGNSSSHIWEQNTILHSWWHAEAGREGGHIRTPEMMMNQLRPVAMKKNVEKLLLDYCKFDEDEDNENSKAATSLLEYIFH